MELLENNKLDPLYARPDVDTSGEEWQDDSYSVKEFAYFFVELVQFVFEDIKNG